MEGKLYYDYTLTQWIVFIVCYGVFFFFGGIESSESIYYSLMKSELQIPYRIQGWLVSMGSYSFILGSPIVGYLMTLVDVKPILILGFSFYIVAYLLLYFFKRLWIVFVSLFIEGIGAVLLDVGMNTLSTVLFPKHRGVDDEFSPLLLSEWVRAWTSLLKSHFLGVEAGISRHLPGSDCVCSDWFPIDRVHASFSLRGSDGRGGGG